MNQLLKVASDSPWIPRFPHSVSLFEATRPLFSAFDGAATKLWKSDGTSSGTTYVGDVTTLSLTPPYAPSPLSQFYYPPVPPIPTSAVAGNTFFFAGWDAAHGYELWKRDECGKPARRGRNGGARSTRRGSASRRAGSSDQVFLLTVMVGNLAEKSLAFSAIPTATRRATAL